MYILFYARSLEIGSSFYGCRVEHAYDASMLALAISLETLEQTRLIVRVYPPDIRQSIQQTVLQSSAFLSTLSNISGTNCRIQCDAYMP